MQAISLLIYDIAIRFYGLGILIGSLFNAKAKLWVDGRSNQARTELPKSTGRGKRIWVHCASLGEFEQARPVIEKIKAEKPSSFIVLTFFSPSGYEIRKNYQYADAVLYLPLDTAKNAADFIDLVKPDQALFVKYEFWHHYITELKYRGIKTVLFSAIFRKEQIFFKWYGGFFKNILRCFDKIFVQNKESQQLLTGISVESEISYDTRFDRVYQIAQSAKTFPDIVTFKGENKILIAGSTWKKDEQLIEHVINSLLLKNYKYIIAPHNLEEAELKRLQTSLELNSNKTQPAKCIRLSQLNAANAESYNVILVDTMGDLSSLYQFGEIAYVGGGFNASVHNVLEPAVYGMPVIFGPNYKKSAEAKELRQISAAFPVSDAVQLQTIVTGFQNNPSLLKNASANAKQYVQTRLGGVNDIYKYIGRYL